MLRRVMIALCSVVLLAAPVAAWQPSAGQEEFMPVDQLPPTEQLAAAPLLVAAYAFVWLALMAYLWLIWRRVGKVEAEMRVLDERRRRRSGA